MKHKTKLKTIQNIFLKGFFVILPIGLTIFLLIYLFDLLDNLLGTPISNVIGVDIPGLGFVILLGTIFLIGLFVSNVVGHRITKMIEDIFKNMPIVKKFYTPIKEVMKSISGEDRVGSFRKVVYTEFPTSGAHSIGFITNEGIDFGGILKDAVFIPTTPNPTNGFLVYLEPSQYQVVDMPVEDAVKMVVSLGTVSPDMMKSAERLEVVEEHLA